MAQKCVHKGCGKTFSDSDEDCVYHPGPPLFHEGQKGVRVPPPHHLLNAIPGTFIDNDDDEQAGNAANLAS